MAVGVVAQLEVIYADSQQRHGRGTRAQFSACPLEERAAQWQARQLVRLRAATHAVEPRTSGRRTDATTRSRQLARHLLERREQPGIELMAHVMAHDVQRFLVRERTLVAPLRRERVVDVRDAQNASRQRNLLADETMRIALAVPALVVRFD